ncbi:hypothetical protein B0F90DRAFT_1031075 [Multifurca ochricompacta]|uniref:Uncharacterized protein n=1 Tax=Multifurca ochricompacta TaxID=376703 RepID=A0AAD4M1N3_9AGAM|nr:hypothetical protein B0F90DRAFT_1031075 [Multifurca ochricompacta]
MAESPFSETRVLGILLLAILLNTYLFGVISQQIYSYWTCGFKDSRRLISLLWVMAWNVYIVRSVHTASKVATWEGPANAVCQCILILSANIFLAARIHKLTSSRLQSRLVITLSISAFVIRLVNLVTTWISKKYPQTQYTVSQRTMSVVWHTIQAVCECLIMSSLSRVLLSSRSGLQKSDRIVNHLIRNVIKNGLFATLWSIAGLATYFLLPDWAIFVIFDMTSGKELR